MSVLRFASGLTFTLGAAGAVLAVSSLRGSSRAWEIVGGRWATTLMQICGLEIQVSGQENLVEPAVFVANHQSFLDPMVLTALLPVRTKWVAKAEFRRVPLLGQAFGACAIYVERRNPSAARAALSEGLSSLPPGWSLALFPEGTRSPDRELQDFKKGAVHLALALGLPLVPLGIAAEPETLPRSPGQIRPGRIQVEVGAALTTAGWSPEEAAEHTATLRTAVSEALARAKARV